MTCGEEGHDYMDHLVEIVDAGDIAFRLDVKRRTVYQWRHRQLLPAPDFRSRPPLWRWSTVQAWAAKTGRLGGA